MTKVNLPYNWTPRHYQEAFWNAMLRGCTRAMLVWHRRAGKDLTALNWAVFDMTLLHPGGSWWHVWPTKEQGRKFWEGADNTGRRYTDYFPPQLIKRKREDMMMIELHNGSIYRVVGSDDPDALVGANPIGLIMTEYSLQNPAAWDFLRPIVSANGGTAIFPFTPRGHNHAYQMYANIRNNEHWFVSKLGVDDTNAVKPEVIQEERDSGMSEDLIQQEYYVSFSAPMTGAYFSQQVKLAYSQDRITRVPYDPALPVTTRWDLGMNDQTAVWFTQEHYNEVRAIDYMQGADRSLVEWIHTINAKPYVYNGHIGPHDLMVREMSTGKTRLDTARSHGIDFHVAKRLPKMDQIDAARNELNMVWFDEENCFEGIEALKAYCKKWDDKRQVYSDKPEHNWASHAADAWMTGSITKLPNRRKDLRKRASPVYDPYKNSRPYAGGGYD